MRLKTSHSIFFLLVLFVSMSAVHAQDSLAVSKEMDRLRVEIKKSKGNLDRATNYRLLAQAFSDQENLDSAVHYASLSLDLFMSTDNRKDIAKGHELLESLNMDIAEYNVAMENNFAALAIYEEIGDRAGVAKCYTRLGDLFYYEDHYEKGIEYCNMAIAIQEELDVPIDLATSYRYRSYNELQMHLYDQALSSINTAIDIHTAAGATELELRPYTNSRGNIYKYMKRYDEALAEYRGAYTLTKESGSPESELVPSIGNIGHVYTLQGKHEEAIPYTIEAIEIMKRTGHITNLWENYMHLSNQYEAIGDLENALKYNRLYTDQHSDYQYKTIANLNDELQVKYETAKREETISEQSSIIAQQRKTQILYISIAALLAAMAFGLMYFNKKRKSRNQELTQLNSELDKKNTQNELLLREIHHRVKNNLAIVQSLISLQSAKMEDSAGKDAMIASNNRVKSMGIIHQRLYQGTDLGAIEMREYFQTLGEGILDAYGAHAQVKIDCNMDKLELDVDTAIPIGLIVNELLTNALKYAFPAGRKGKVDIHLERLEEGMLQLNVKDNGVGKQLNEKDDGFGTQLISLLCKQLKGKLEETVSEGTSVAMRLKIRKAV